MATNRSVRRISRSHSASERGIESSMIQANRVLCVIVRPLQCASGARPVRVRILHVVRELSLAISLGHRRRPAAPASGASLPGTAQPELDRIARERQRALDRYVRDRDAAALGEAMAALDRDQAAVQAPRPSEPVPADVAVRYLRELPETWRKAKGGKGRQMLASALFDRIDVLGIREATVYLSAHAVRHGLATVLPAELGETGRGERT